MTLPMPWMTRRSFFFIPLTLAGCAARPPAPVPPTDSLAVLADARLAGNVNDRNAAALRQLTQSSDSAVNAVKAIDVARDIAVTNIANAQTGAYKAQRLFFEVDGKYRVLLDLSQGSMQNTGSNLDLGIQGEGYIAVKIRPSLGKGGVGYTRVGSLTTNSQGELLLNIGDGYALSPPITLPTNATNINVGVDGTVQYVKAGATTKSTVGQIKLAMFPDAQGLNLLGGSVYTESDASGPPVMTVPGDDGSGQILSGFLESSNVDLTRETMRLQSLNEWRTALLRAVGIRE